MRPRLLHLGYASDPNAFHRRMNASMRPRLLHLGYVLGAAGLDMRRTLLQ